MQLAQIFLHILTRSPLSFLNTSRQASSSDLDTCKINVARGGCNVNIHHGYASFNPRDELPYYSVDFVRVGNKLRQMSEIQFRDALLARTTRLSARGTRYWCAKYNDWSRRSALLSEDGSTCNSILFASRPQKEESSYARCCLRRLLGSCRDWTSKWRRSGQTTGTVQGSLGR